MRDNLVKLKKKKKASKRVFAALTSSVVSLAFLKDILDVCYILTMGFVGNLPLKWRRLGVGARSRGWSRL